MKSTSLFFLSVFLNIALAVAAVRLFRMPVAVVSPSETNPVFLTAPAEQSSNALTVAPVSGVTNRFHWRQLESTNYDTFVANLRAVGCPEKTIRDIILAGVEKLFAARRRALEHQGTFWLAGNRQRKAQQTRDRKLEALERERETLIHRLLGVEWFPDSGHLSRDFEEQALSRFILGPMPEETYQRAVHLLEQYDSLKDEVERRCDGIRLEEDTAQLRNLYQRMWQELASALTPAQLEELMARGSVNELFNHTELAGVEITAAEARQIALARAAAGGRLFDWPDDETDEEKSANEEKFQAAVRTLLGEKRYADFERAQDREFRTLFDLGKDHGLSQAVAVQIYEIQKLTRDEVQRLRQDPALDEAARQQHLDEMQTAVQQEILSALGSGVCQEYLQRGGTWVTNLNTL
jgi:hypothetical protein